MQEALRGLPKDLRDVMWMFLFEEQPMPRVAEQLGVSLATAKRRFFEASQSYRQLLQERLGTRVGGSFHKR
jgi:DNA-directed RNA polymerase specialized sigma24 family protein